jgi:hypothetical protein
MNSPKSIDRKLLLQFRVDPVWLANETAVPDPVKIIITDAEAVFLTGIL